MQATVLFWLQFLSGNSFLILFLKSFGWAEQWGNDEACRLRMEMKFSDALEAKKDTEKMHRLRLMRKSLEWYWQRGLMREPWVKIISGHGMVVMGMVAGSIFQNTHFGWHDMCFWIGLSPVFDLGKDLFEDKLPSVIVVASVCILTGRFLICHSLKTPIYFPGGWDPLPNRIPYAGMMARRFHLQYFRTCPTMPDGLSRLTGDAWIPLDEWNR